MQFGGFLPEETLNAHDDGAIYTNMLGELASFLEIKLAHQSIVDIEDITAHFTLREDHLAFGEFHGYEHALQDIQFIMGHRAVSPGQFAGHITCCQSNCCHFLYLS